MVTVRGTETEYKVYSDYAGHRNNGDYAGYNKYMVTTQDTEIYMESQDSLLVEHLTCEQKVVNSVCSRSRGRIFFSQLSLCADSYSVSVPPPCYCRGT